MLLAFVGVYSHVFLDYLNNYGVRLATPISWQWFYGDAIFIVDPWMWIVLAVGVWMTGSRGRPRPARVALVAVGCYIVGDADIRLGGARHRGRDLEGGARRSSRGRSWSVRYRCGHSADRSSSTPATTTRRHVLLVATGGHVRSRADSQEQPTRPQVAAARRDNNIRAFLVWARFPFWTIEPTPAGTRVTVSDMRLPAERFRSGPTKSWHSAAIDDRPAAICRRRQ